MAQLIPADSSRDFKTFNRLLAGRAETWSTEASPVGVVDCQTGFNVDTMTYDGLHPSGKGERLIAERFFQALGGGKNNSEVQD